MLRFQSGCLTSAAKKLATGFNRQAGRLARAYARAAGSIVSRTPALEVRNRELALLYDSAAFLQKPQSVEALCEGFFDRISKYFGVDGGSVRVLDPARGNLHMVVHRGISEQLARDEHCLKVGDCLCGEAAGARQAVVHDLRKMDKREDLRCHREGFVTVAVFHIHAHDQYIGLFSLHFRHPKMFAPHEKALLDTLGQLLGVAIASRRLSAREREMAISEERNLMAQGLHDSIAQALSFLNIQVQMLENSLGNGRLREANDIVPALRAGVQESYEDVRELLLNFRTRLAEGDLVRSLQATIDRFERQTGIAVDFSASGNGPPFPIEQQLQILFIVQEALSNIRKHAKASRAGIRIEDDGDFVLTIRDDGVGCDANAILQKGESHVGIHIMRERAQRISARFELASAAGAGVTVTLRLPQAMRRAA